MKEKNLYSENEKEIIERQFVNYFMKSLYYIRADYYRNKKKASKKVEEILTDDIENKYCDQIIRDYTEDTITHELCYNIDINYIDNKNLYETLSKFSKLDIEILNLLVINGYTQKEIAQHLNVSQPRVSTIKKKYSPSLENPFQIWRYNYEYI